MRPCVRPVVIPEKCHRPLDVAAFDRLRFRPAGPRPVQKSQRPRKPQHMRGPFAEVFTLPSVELVLPVVREGGEVCEGVQGIWRQRDIPGDKGFATPGPAVASVG